ncbi:SLC13 family permease [Halanaeroarchaeum sulfurireducens]|uniref:Potassium transporter TrkA n=1 Tax=Halanaeroarchaeum sulfurireducens TaxID=1604004 RepID=A0A0F7P747_9EURY|nr:SLC13 family permease [Halanaeroarchaeum sulfurireducens]AKH97031.1 potassium transporter TrkA [Halanaeroarchaeum sulfurireducens]
MSIDVFVVFAIIGGAMVLFVTEAVESDVTAIAVLVSLVVLGEFTGVSPTDALSGFANPATVTVIAMYILSEAVRQTGVVTRVGRWITAFARGSERRLMGGILGTTGLAAGFVNNTPVVAVFIPMIHEIAAETNVSPSKLFLPLSYAAMLGGTLTLIGTSTNLVVSNVAARAGEAGTAPELHALGMFEFTVVGVVVFAVGLGYLLTVGRWLTPARVSPETTLVQAYDLERHLSQVVVREESPLVGTPVSSVGALLRSSPADGNGDVPIEVSMLQLVRDGEPHHALSSEASIEAGDVLTVRGNRRNVNRFAERYELRQLPHERVTAGDLDVREGRGSLVEAVVPEGSRLHGDSVREANLAGYHAAQVLALRRGGSVRTDGIGEHELSVGDTLLVQVRERDLRYLVENGDLVVTRGLGIEQPEERPREPLSSSTPVVFATVAMVVALAALGVLPIVISALAGVVVLFASDAVSPGDAYAAVNWNVVFLLAGVIPLGIALTNSGGDVLLADAVVALDAVLAPIYVLAVLYLLTGLFSAIITPVATVVLLTPVAIDAAVTLGANPLAFVLGVLFAANSAFMTPIGYQTNLMVYAPGGYRFSDYLRVGAPLFALSAVVAIAGIAIVWGL